MRVAIIAFNNIKYSPYARTYFNLLDKRNVCYDVILPDRNSLNESFGNETYSIEWNAGKSKIFNFIKFTKETKKILKKNKYDFVIVLTTIPAVLLSDFLVKHYKNRYIVDIRDYTYEKIGLFYKMEEKVLKNARMRVISSSGFKNFLPDTDYSLCHNTSYDFADCKQEFKRKTDGKITVGYVGSVSYVARCKQMIDLVDKDERFNLHFYGNETHGTEISSYIESKNNERIKYFGGYEPSQKDSIIESVDLLFNVYGNGSPLVKYAVSNKLYDSFFFKKPLLTSPDTVMSEYAGDYSFDIDTSLESLDGLYEWYASLDSEAMIEYMNDRLKEYSEDIKLFNKNIDDIFVAEAM